MDDCCNEIWEPLPPSIQFYLVIRPYSPLYFVKKDVAIEVIKIDDRTQIYPLGPQMSLQELENA